MTSSQDQLNQLKNQFLDPLANELAEKVRWKYIKGFSNKRSDLYPIATLGKGPSILMLHGFDSCFLEFRRLVPLLEHDYKLIIPDLYGFGFCPRPKINNYGFESVISHLNQILDDFALNSPIGILGASMGGAVAMELTRRNPNKISRLLLLSPAGLCNDPKHIPWPLDQLGVWFLKQPCIRKNLCRQAFANPRESVGKAEEEIASIHLNVPGWHRSLASFARNGGVAYSKKTIPSHPINVLWGAQDRIISTSVRKESMLLLNRPLIEIEDCGHLPHLDKPNIVAENCKGFG